MIENEDPLLKDETVFRPSGILPQEPYINGLNMIGITEAQVEACGDLIQEIYQKMADKCIGIQSARNSHTMFKGAVFALGTRFMNNPEWREHCASSLREIFHEWKGKHLSELYNDLYRKNKIPLNTEESTLLKRLNCFYDFFTGIDHHEPGKMVHALKYLVGNNDLKYHSLTDELFIELVQDFFMNMLNFVELAKKDSGI